MLLQKTNLFIHYLADLVEKELVVVDQSRKASYFLQ
jgi:hypothetical protein